jgi:hypothetical protein
MFDGKERKKTFAKKKRKEKSIVFLLFKRSRPQAKSWIMSPGPLSKSPPLPNHYHLFQEIMKKERTSPNKSEFLIVKVTFVGTQNNAYDSSIFFSHIVLLDTH